jgi:DNA adenine methylase
MNNFYSPLRYPGGKKRLTKFVSKICVDNNIYGHYIEPYAGGASVALHLLIENYVEKVTINDYDKAINAFWYSVLNKTDELCDLIKETNITPTEWKKQKIIQKNEYKNLLTLGFSTLFLNRTNYSGIIKAGMIGGQNQSSKYKLNCRFNKDIIIEKIQLIAKYKNRIYLKNADALELTGRIKKNKNTLFYFDPPYYSKGPLLYMNYYNHNDHERISKEIKNIKNANWIVSYDDIEQIRNLYKNITSKTYNLHHSAHSSRVGKEIEFFSDSLIVDTYSPIV